MGQPRIRSRNIPNERRQNFHRPVDQHFRSSSCTRPKQRRHPQFARGEECAPICLEVDSPFEVDNSREGSKGSTLCDPMGRSNSSELARLNATKRHPEERYCRLCCQLNDRTKTILASYMEIKDYLISVILAASDFISTSKEIIYYYWLNC